MGAQKTHLTFQLPDKQIIVFPAPELKYIFTKFLTISFSLGDEGEPSFKKPTFCKDKDKSGIEYQLAKFCAKINPASPMTNAID
jgi:hypothetical protein